MRKIITAVCTVALAVGMGLGTAGPAAAGLEYRDGGKWYWQYTTMILESNYYHASKTHRSSVKTPHELVRSPWKSGGLWSYSSIYPNPGGGNSCHYAFA
ncbi:lactococcin 972 family bacteriocin [Cellulosimicrobium protaetiae]|uniref:Lactococcin 972 family bacteriocin n=1 Tax=Cellulosimicrobium protaetiae TaxID=2587808 RepID=A0A6M5UHI1_9MICO|nr:lactococcin 972 family bacteriocin [Cellulosimicrobium protaetiae]QJW37590.1 hypothetical protein FIC82_016770 [Cellulosimicrobium protaetiae]